VFVVDELGVCSAVVLSRERVPRSSIEMELDGEAVGGAIVVRCTEAAGGIPTGCWADECLATFDCEREVVDGIEDFLWQPLDSCGEVIVCHAYGLGG